MELVRKYAAFSCQSRRKRITADFSLSRSTLHSRATSLLCRSLVGLLKLDMEVLEILYRPKGRFT